MSVVISIGTYTQGEQMITTSKITNVFEGAETLMYIGDKETPAKQWVFFTLNSKYMATLPLDIFPVMGESLTCPMDWMCRL